MSANFFFKDDICFVNNRPFFKYGDLVNIDESKIISVLSGNIRAKHDNKIVRGISKGYENGIYKVQLIKLI